MALRFDLEHAIFSHEPSSLALFSRSPVRKWLFGFQPLALVLVMVTPPPPDDEDEKEASHGDGPRPEAMEVVLVAMRRSIMATDTRGAVSDAEGRYPIGDSATVRMRMRRGEAGAEAPQP